VICDFISSVPRVRQEVGVGRVLSARLPRLVLASRSPRRQRLLNEHGLAHDTVDSTVDDGQLLRGEATPAQWVASLAYLKAAAGADALGARLDGRVIVLGADTVCVKNGEVIGQPKNAADAERILRTLENGSHEVVTGVALLRIELDGSRSRDVSVDRAQVAVGQIGRDRIASYIAGAEWRGKAGGYNLFERIDDGWPITFDGDPTAIMGLPMRLLMSRLYRATAEMA
jgi:septum formation protein